MYELILGNFSRHITLDKTEEDYLCSKLQTKTFKKNSELLRAGAICKNIYFVNEGCLRIFNRDRKAGDHNIMFCPENWWATDLASFSDQTPAFSYIAALEETEVFYLNYQALEKLYIQMPKLERFFRILSQNGFSLFQQRVNSNLSLTAKERYVQFQQQYPGLEQRISQKQIASYLGITPVFLSMLRKRKK